MSYSLEWSATHGGFVVGDFESDPVQDKRDARRAHNAFMKAMLESAKRERAKTAAKKSRK